MQLQHSRHHAVENTFRSSLQRELFEIQIKAQNTLPTYSESAKIPDTAYNDTLFLLEIMYNTGIPIPDINRTNHGSISLKWYSENGAAFMELCGDGLVVYTAYSDEDSKDDGACLLSDTAALDELLESLRCVY